MIKRRVIISGLLSLIGVPALVSAQSTRAAGKIGYLHTTTISPTNYGLSIIRPIWERLGYVDGETVLLRSGEGDPQRLSELVRELISLEVGVLLVVGPAAVRAARQTTSTLPIIAIDLETDPVRSRLIASFGQPGSNVTGLFMDQASLTGKWLELLKEIAPSIDRIALVWDPNTGPDQLDAAKATALTIGIETLVLEVRSTEDYEAAFKSLGSERRTGIVQLGSPALVNPPTRFGNAALKYRLPAISFQKNLAMAGTLMAYGPNLELYFPRAVILADKILKGATPRELPIERPDRFELIINRKTAKALGIEISPSLLARADEVIE
jgi:putative tryptophan/tyrosine transport system substrate-binding protein